MQGSQVKVLLTSCNFPKAKGPNLALAIKLYGLQNSGKIIILVSCANLLWSTSGNNWTSLNSAKEWKISEVNHKFWCFSFAFNFNIVNAGLWPLAPIGKSPGANSFPSSTKFIISLIGS